MADLIESAASGDRRLTLEALRDKVAASIQECESGRDVAALSKRLMEIMAELDSMPKPEADDELSELQELYG